MAEIETTKAANYTNKSCSGASVKRQHQIQLVVEVVPDLDQFWFLVGLRDESDYKLDERRFAEAPLHFTPSNPALSKLS